MGTDVLNYRYADKIRGEGEGKFTVWCCVTVPICQAFGKMCRSVSRALKERVVLCLIVSFCHACMLQCFTVSRNLVISFIFLAEV